MKWHSIDKRLLDNHKILVHVIGCGGTGSHVLTNLAMINEGMKHHGRNELLVTAFDDKVVSDHNIGRQTFSHADIGRPKSVVMIERINRFYRYGWEAISNKWTTDYSLPHIIISAVDLVAPRIEINNAFKSNIPNKSSYWIDIGNGESDGQVVLAHKNVRNKTTLPTFIDMFGNDIPEDKEAPSCSAVESLAKQDMFINKFMATLATNMLWTLLVNFRIHYRAIFANLADMDISKVPV
jgi:PRTRC genetic system ThiF family protein